MAAETGRFRPADRLRQSRDFERVGRSGVRRATEAFVVLRAPCPVSAGGARVRLGITASRKVGGAVVRNRVKRNVREWFRRVRDELSPEGDWVVIARPAAAGLSGAELRAVLIRLAAAHTDRSGA